MSRRKGRSQRGTWQQQQQRASLNHKAISLPPIDSRPFQLEFQLQIVLRQLQDAFAAQGGDVEAAMACPGALAAVSHLRSCTAAGGHCDWNTALLVWLLLSRWTEAASLHHSAEQDEFAAANNIQISTGLLARLAGELGWSSFLLAALHFSRVAGKEADRLQSLLLNSLPSAKAISPQLCVSSLKDPFSTTAALGQHPLASLWSSMLAAPWPGVSTSDASGGAEHSLVEEGTGLNSAAPARITTQTATGITPAVLLVTQAIVECMPGQPGSMPGVEQPATESANSTVFGPEHAWTEDVFGRPQPRSPGIAPLTELSEPDSHSPLCMAAAFLSMAQRFARLGQRPPAAVSNEDPAVREPQVLESISREALPLLLHSAANAMAQVAVPEQRRALLTEALQRCGFELVWSAIEQDQGLSLAVTRGLIAASNRMIAGKAEGIVFERLPAWVTARASELAPLAVLAPHATLRRLVTDGLWHTTQGHLLIEVLHALDPLPCLPGASGAPILLLEILCGQLQQADAALRLEATQQAFVAFAAHLAQPHLSGGLLRPPLVTADQLVSHLLALQLDSRALSEAGLRVCLQLARALLLPPLEGNAAAAEAAAQGGCRLSQAFEEGWLPGFLLRVAEIATGEQRQRLAYAPGRAQGGEGFTLAARALAANLVEDLSTAAAQAITEQPAGTQAMQRACSRLSKAVHERDGGNWPAKMLLLPLLSACQNAEIVPAGESQGQAVQPAVPSVFRPMSIDLQSAEFCALVSLLQDAMMFCGSTTPAAHSFAYAWAMGLAGCNFEGRCLVEKLAAEFAAKVLGNRVHLPDTLLAAAAWTLHALSSRQFARVCEHVLPLFCQACDQARKCRGLSPMGILCKALYLLASCPELAPFPCEALSAGPSQERQAAVEAMLHGIAGFCQTAAQQTTPSSNSDNARKKNAAETFATACGVIGALQPVYLCKAAQPLLLQLLKACKTDCISTQKRAASLRRCVDLLKDQTLQNSLLAILEAC